MAITKMSNSGIATGGSTKYDDMLAGNPPFIPNSFESIATVTSGGTSLVLSSIPSTYAHLQVRVDWARDSGNSSLQMVVNNDTGANYTTDYMYGNSSSAFTVIQNSGSAVIDIGTGYIGGTTRGAAVIEILNYANTNMWKTTRALAGGMGTSQSQITYNTGLYMSTSAITSLTFNISGDTFASDTKIALYGIKGS